MVPVCVLRHANRICDVHVRTKSAEEVWPVNRLKGGVVCPELFFYQARNPYQCSQPWSNISRPFLHDEHKSQK